VGINEVIEGASERIIGKHDFGNIAAHVPHVIAAKWAIDATETVRRIALCGKQQPSALQATRRDYESADRQSHPLGTVGSHDLDRCDETVRIEVKTDYRGAKANVDSGAIC
jgi:hypothetical protein